MLELEPANMNAYFNRGSAYDSKGMYKESVEDFTKALELEQAGQ